MLHIRKWLTLFALLILVGSLPAACVPGPAVEHPLQPTLSLLETKAAGLQKTVTLTPLPTGALPVPFTGTGATQVVVTQPPLLIQEPSLTPAPLQLDLSPTVDPLLGQPSPTIDCPTHEAEVTLSTPRETLKVGEAIEIKVTLNNTGCVMLGLPQYRLAILNSEGRPVFSPDKPEPIIHSKGINPGETDEVSYVLQAISPGKATLTALASFEVHLGYPGPAYWGAGSSKELVIQVEP